VLIGIVCLLSACASFGRHSASPPTTAFVVTDDGSEFADHAPVFLHQNDDKSFNRIGQAAARYDRNGKEQIYIDAASPTVYVQQRHFSGRGGRYTNLIYRVHFERVPVRWVPFHVTAGKNMGLFLIVTLDQRDRAVLVTTVHTCGCYLAFVPTDILPQEAYPDDWELPNQKVFGEMLPAQLRLAGESDEVRTLAVYLRGGTHRVMDLRLVHRSELKDRYRIQRMSIEPIEALKTLSLDAGTTSFYHSSGPRKGYVKNTFKPFELLLLSWWVLDLNVGIDKEYGDSQQTGTVFYTSLKPWRRKASDMWEFVDFLTYWGWKL